MIVRRALSDDIDSIIKLDKESVKEHSEFDRDFYNISPKWWNSKRDAHISAINDTSCILTVAVENGSIIGYVSGYIDKIGEIIIGKLQDIIVTKDFRKKGIATSLINEIIIFFRNNKCAVCETDVNAKNKTAINFYEKNGFNMIECKMRFKIDKSKKYSPLY